jgi:hypothetical protein
VPVPVRPETKVASGKPTEHPPPRPTILSKRGAEILVRVERMMDDANRAMAPLRPTVSTDRKNQAEGSLPSPSEAPQTAHALASALEGQAFSGRN